MPIYEYRSQNPSGDCSLCAKSFESLQGLAEAPLQVCPQCGHAVQRVISAPNVRRGDAQRLKESHLAKHGFTQYKKAAKGIYEKTAGKGPAYIADDGK